jgi:hypothetical protein
VLLQSLALNFEQLILPLRLSSKRALDPVSFQIGLDVVSRCVLQTKRHPNWFSSVARMIGHIRGKQCQVEDFEGIRYLGRESHGRNVRSLCHQQVQDFRVHPRADGEIQFGCIRGRVVG